MKDPKQDPGPKKIIPDPQHSYTSISFLRISFTTQSFTKAHTT